MKTSHIVFVLLLSFVVALATTKYVGPSTSSQAAAETAYQRVMRTGELRCGYAVYAPYFTKDPVTGDFGGIWHDLTEAMAENLGLKVVWASEIGLGEVATALETKRIDLFCGGLWTVGKRVAVVDFLKPSAFEPLLVYVHMDDHRFDQNIDAINDPSIKISTIDGEGGGLAAAERFPKATLVSLPQMSSYSDMFNQVFSHKADLLMTSPSGAAAFLKNNPGVLRALIAHPIKIFACSFGVRYGESELRDMLNQAQDDVMFNGELEKIISKSEVNKGDFWRVTQPYVPQTEK